MTLSSSPSEDMSHLLVKPVSAMDDFDFDAPRDYLPDPTVEWVVTIVFEKRVSRTDINSTLDTTWLEENGKPILYGLPTDGQHWTFVNAADAPDSFTNLKLAWPLWNSLDEEPMDLSAHDLEGFRASAQVRLSALGESRTSTDQSAEDALTSVANLPELVSECDQDVILRLAAPKGETFPGREVWDVMLSLGLDYGDGDLFHWINNSGVGDDHFLTVETSTSPGYFNPRRMASGEGDVEDLIFGYSIPRSADPGAVFDSLTRAVEYAQKRLGGEIVLGSGERFDAAAERANIEVVVRKLKDAGVNPGESSTLRVF